MTKLTKTTWAAVGVSVLASGLLPTAHAQSSEALMDVLVRKGILTDQEAEDIKADLTKENKQFNKWALSSDAVTYKLYGDVRGRYEAFRTENDAPGASEPSKPRDRFRYRLRAGVTATLKEQFEVGLRLTSSEPAGNTGGDPISGNSTFQDNGSKKFIYIDLAYGKWTPIKTDGLTLGGTIGKMENPFVLSDMVFDGDYTPEGAAIQGGYKFNDMHSLNWNGGVFVLDEVNQGALASNDPIMYGFQLRWDAKWTPKVQTTAGASWLALSEEESLGNGAVPNIQFGNSRHATAVGTHAVGDLIHNYNPFVFDASATYTFDKAPLYPGTFPVRLGAEFMHNPGAPENNNGWWGGVFLGKAGKKGTWELSYRYKRLESDAWYEEFVDSDFGAYYQAVPSQAGLGRGYRSGTGLQGHIVKLAYSLSDSVSLGATWFYTEAIDAPVIAGDETESRQHRLQVDAIWKF